MKSRKKKPARKRTRAKKARRASFGERELVQSLWSTMKDQEKANPLVALLHERMTGNLRLVGLTGGISSGKSTVSGFLQEAGIPVIDADLISREVVRPGRKAYDRIVERFGRGILRDDATIDRTRLGGLVFGDGAARKDLESITHPEIFREIVRRVREIRAEKEPGLIVIDAALLFESGLDRSVDRVLLVRVAPEIQKQRLMKRDGLSPEEATRRIESQLPDADKEARAHHVIDNSGTPEQTREQVLGVLQEIVTGIQ